MPVNVGHLAVRTLFQVPHVEPRAGGRRRGRGRVQILEGWFSVGAINGQFGVILLMMLMILTMMVSVVFESL